MPSPPMRTIERDELRAKLERADRFKLVNSLGEWEFAAKHIPGSIHFASRGAMLGALRPEDDIVVYCTNPSCAASIAAYEVLVNRGYPHVRRYAGGLEDWEAAGLPLDGKRSP